MVKLVLNDIDNESVPSASLTINDNNQRTEDALEKTLSRDGTSPNQMEANLDLNGYRVINHPSARGVSFGNDLVTVSDLAVLGIPGPKGDPGPTGDGSGDMLASNNLSDIADASAARSNLGLEIGSDVLNYDLDLSAIAALNWAPEQLFWKNGSGTVEVVNISAAVKSLLDSNTQEDIRDSLSLGGASLLEVGQTTTTVASGADSRFKRIPISVLNASASLMSSSTGSLVRHTSASAHNYFLPTNLGGGFQAGDVIQIRNAVGAGLITLTPSASVSLYLSGSSTSGVKTIDPGGYCVLVCEDANTWIISGNGVS